MNNYKKSTTAIVCLSPYLGGLELDAIKYTNKLASLAETILICKKDSLLAKKQKTITILQWLKYHFDLISVFHFSISLRKPLRNIQSKI